MERADASPEVFQQFLGVLLEFCSDADLQKMIDEVRRRKHAVMARERSRLLLQYRVRWYPNLTNRAAARAIERDLERMDGSGLRHRSAPALADPKLAQAFELLTSGPPLSADRIRKLFPPVGQR
jgi:hypothetical protein